MPFIADTVFDNGLTTLDTNGTRVDICSSEPATYGQATSTTSLGNAAVNTGAPQNASSGTGRSVEVPAIGNGSVTASGTATHWALTNGTNTLYATGSLAASQAVTSGNTFTLDAFEIIIRDAA